MIFFSDHTITYKETKPLLSRWIIGIFLLGSNITLTAAKAQNGHLIYDTVYGRSLENNLVGDLSSRSTIVYLPPSYFKIKKRYPVVYLLHGNSATNEVWINGSFQGFNMLNVMDSLIRIGTVKEMIVVMPNANNQFRGSHYVNSPVTGNWLDFITKDLVQYVDHKYRTIANSNSRGLAGHSMGGRGTLNIAMKSPGIFGAFYAMSAGVMAFDSFPPVNEGNWRKIITNPTQKDNVSLRILSFAAAFSPNPLGKPQPVDFPFEIVNGDLKKRDTIWQKWLEQDPFYVANIKSANLKLLRGLTFDVGTSDVPILYANRMLSERLSNQGILHRFEEYEGNHTNRIGERLIAQALPFFSQTLVTK